MGGCVSCAGMPGWQWLFIIEGCLTVVYGICVKLLLAPKPSTAWFLQPAEREWLRQRQDNVHTGAVANAGGKSTSILGAHLSDWPVCEEILTVCVPFFGLLM